MDYSAASRAAMMGRPAYMTGAYQAPARPQKVVTRGYQPSSYTPNNYMYNPQMAHLMRQKEDPYVAPEPIVQALRQKSINPEGIRRNANTFKGTANAPVAPEGKTNPSGANRSAQVTSQV
tara:strand:+ start:144 stop:503 length:360 start_codon:yes stop_codon:yes gene_type:complete